MNNYKILIVDDEPFNIVAIENILKYVLKFNVETQCSHCYNGKEAINMITKSVE